ncbi:MAG: hypothetical protein KBC91_02105 [Candidatus Omnitrophica bacterium]|nr:hypothetical protein [Candidatus Omnitrophota bacterium]
MFKLNQILSFMVILLLFQSAANAAEMTAGEKSARIPAIMVRGAFDAITAPAEFFYTPKAESKEHPKLWPVTALPRTITNVSYRLTSALYDMAFYPFAAPFVDEAPPLTEKMGLSADVWENENEY